MGVLVGPVPVQQVTADAQAMTLEAFSEVYGLTVLVRMRSSIQADANQRGQDAWSFGTVHAVKSRVDGPVGGIMDLQDGVAYPVRKVRSRFFSRTILVGRAGSNDLHIADPGISKLHARLRFDGERLLIDDAGSSNGTFLNGERVTSERVVQESDVVSFGALRFRFLHTRNLHAMLRRLSAG